MENVSFIEDINRGCRLGDTSILKQLFDQFPEFLNQKDSKLGWAPLYRTVICGHEAASMLLLDLGADPNIKTNIGETALHQASSNSQYKIAKMLLQYQADPNSQQNDGDTPLHLAAFKGDILMVKLLLSYNADPNVSNNVFGRTPLHYAVDYAHKEVAMLLMKHSASTTIKDMSDKTPLDLARNKDFSQFINDFHFSEESDTSTEITEIGSSKYNKIYKRSQSQIYSIDRHTSLTEISFENSPKKPCKVTSHMRSISTIFEPDAEKSDCEIPGSAQKKVRTCSFGVCDKRPELYLWTVNYKLEEIFDVLVNAGYDDIGQMSVAMNSAMPVTEKILTNIGIPKSGLRRRLLASLDEESRTSGKSTRRHHKRPQNSSI